MVRDESRFFPKSHYIVCAEPFPAEKKRILSQPFRRGGLNPSDSLLNGYIFIFLLTGGAS
jgi:hypothetical protein